MAVTAQNQAAGLITQTEDFIPGLYIDSQGIVTIGYGIALVGRVPGGYGLMYPVQKGVDTLATTLSSAGINLSSDQLNQLESYLNANVAVFNSGDTISNFYI